MGLRSCNHLSETVNPLDRTREKRQPAPGKQSPGQLQLPQYLKWIQSHVVLSDEFGLGISAMMVHDLHERMGHDGIGRSAGTQFVFDSQALEFIHDVCEGDLHRTAN